MFNLYTYIPQHIFTINKSGTKAMLRASRQILEWVKSVTLFKMQ